MADSSFDIVSKVDKQEVANALNTAAKEISTRYDFKGVGASIAFSRDDGVLIKANSEERVLAVLDVFQTWLVKRKVSLKHLDYGSDEKPTPRVSGKEYRLEVGLKQGINQETAKKIGKILRDEGPKSVKSQIQGDELRVTSKSRDDLQAVQALLRDKDLDTALQFTNYR
jgi:cyclic-di-GMP-binding protein